MPSFLLPDTPAVQIVHKRGRMTERLLAGHDAAIVISDVRKVDESLTQLPASALWQQLYRDTHSHGAIHTLCARPGPSATLVTLVPFDRESSSFEQLTLAGRAWKDIGIVAPGRVLVVALPGVEARSIEALLAAVLAGAATLPAFKSKRTRRRRLHSLTILGAPSGFDSRRTLAAQRGNHLARWLTLLPPNILHPASYRRALAALARREGWSFKFYSQSTLRRLGAGAFLAVARASRNDAAGVVRLTYRPHKSTARARLALVGKGVCFDTGGINVKPHKGMYQMHADMQGSAVAVGSLLALSDLEASFGIDCWLALAENEIGPNAYRPQEVVHAANGLSIQIAHSDAEGRLLLADTLALAARERPDVILDYATLTGACVSALTERYSGVFTNREELQPVLQTAGRISGERVWPFPMDEDYDRDLESGIADLLQCTPDSKGDHILGARFLSHFVPRDIAWAHVDLASGNNKGGLAHIPTDITGFGVRWTSELLLGQQLLQHIDKMKQ